MISRCRPSDFCAVAAFARSQPEFDYLKAIIRAHTVRHSPGGVYVWREETGDRRPGTDDRRRTRDRRLITDKPSAVSRLRSIAPRAICGLAHINSHDSWL